MRMFKTASIFLFVFFATFILFSILLYADRSSSKQSTVSEQVQLCKADYSNNADEDEQNKTSVHTRKNIFFLKTHKCASSTVQNILLRYGRENSLLFVLPSKNNYIGHPRLFERSLITEDLRSEDNTYNVFTHHSRYNPTEVKKVMKQNAAFVTILRDPGTLFESLYNFYHLEKRTDVSFEKFNEDPDKYRTLMDDTRKGSRYGQNQMCFDLGLNDTVFYTKHMLEDFVHTIEHDFDLVMIAEHMEASLVLLADLMGWSLDQVVFLDNNVRQSKSKTSLTEADKQKLRDFNQADTIMYKHFLEIFKDKLQAYGVDKMKLQVDKLITMNFNFFHVCVEKVTTKGYARTYSYDIKVGAPPLCYFAAKQELPFTDQLRNEQIYRLAQLRKIEVLISKLNES